MDPEIEHKDWLDILRPCLVSFDGPSLDDAAKAYAAAEAERHVRVRI